MSKKTFDDQSDFFKMLFNGEIVVGHCLFCKNPFLIHVFGYVFAWHQNIINVFRSLYFVIQISRSVVRQTVCSNQFFIARKCLFTLQSINNNYMWKTIMKV